MLTMVIMEEKILMNERILEKEGTTVYEIQCANINNMNL